MKKSRYILLDRDGVINIDSDQYIKNTDEWLPIKGSIEAIVRLTQHNYKIIVITNQSGLARGLFDNSALKAIHQKMLTAVENAGGEIEAIYYCPHGPDEQCACRKPKPGLLEQFAHDYGVSLAGIPFIGDSLKDLQAGMCTGMQPMLVKTGKGTITAAENPDLNIPIFENLYEAAKYILSR